MELSFVQIDDLPDEILLVILKKLSNIQVLYSLFGINQRLNTIVQDPAFTSHLTLFERSTDLNGVISNNHINALSDSMINRFSLQILPAICEKIKWLDIEPTCIERILATKYSNLRGLGVYKVDIDTVISLFTNSFSQSLDENIFNDVKNQIVSLDINIPYHDGFKISTKGHIIRFLFTHVLNMFTNLQCLKFALNPFWDQKSSFNYISSTVRSSTLLELHVHVESFSDCLYLLDGRLNQLHTFHVHTETIISEQSTTINQEKLPTLQCFSLYCDCSTDFYDELVVPLLHRMMNLEKLDLCLGINRYRGFVDGNDLKEDIMKYMPQLKEFTFDIRTFNYSRDQINVPSNEDVQRTFEGFPSIQIVAWTDHFEIKGSQCYIHSYPYRMKYYRDITNQFPGGLFQCVTAVSLYDERPFEREFFVRIEKSFPMMTELTIENKKPQKNRLHGKSTHNDQDMSIIQYPHLQWLDLQSVHDDYVEQFLLDTEICLPNNVNLLIDFESLKTVTHNFQRDETRVNCAKMVCNIHKTQELPEQAKRYFSEIHRFGLL